HVDDVPYKGPSLYVVLSGFHDPDLPAELLNIGIPLVCMLEIKLPGEQYVAYHETKEQDFISHDKTRFSEDYRIDVNKLDEFWTITRERFANLSVYPIYSDIASLTLSPAALPETLNITEKKFLKRDIHDRALRTLYHLYDLYRQHAKYLKSMKL
ncbi:Sperm-associated antigen 17, partial [Camponotus floridanus]